MSVSAIIVNYKTAEMVGQLCGHLEEFPEISAIIVVDNSGEMVINDKIPQRVAPELIRSGSNIGFGAAVNAGLKRVQTDWVLVINPDVRLEKRCLRRLRDAASGYEAVLVGPRFYWDDAFQFRLPPATGDSMGMSAGIKAASHFELDARLASFYWEIRHGRFWSAQKPFFEPFLSGACLLADMNWIRKKGGLLFDERFFLYYEDTDLCVQAVLDGVRPLCVPDAQAVHYYNQSPEPARGKLTAMADSAKQFFEKYYGKRRINGIEGTERPVAFEPLGEKRVSPVFDIDPVFLTGDAVFEISTNPIFVPFAQCDVVENPFQFPESVWSRLAPGHYFSRVREIYTNEVRHWEWKKI